MKMEKFGTAPLTQWVYGMLYNADVLEANDIDPCAIKTWDDFKAACEKLEANGTTHWLSQERTEVH